MLAWVGVAAAAECPERLARDAFDERLARAEAAWVELDEPRFRDEMNVLGALVVPCLGDLVPTPLAARWHRVMAVHLDALGDGGAGAAAAAAAHRLDPALAFGDDWVGADHPLRVAWDGAADARTRALPRARSGRLVIDGAVTRERPVGAPALVQVFDDTGLATATAYVGPGGDVPAYPAVPRARLRLVAATAATAAVAGVGFLAASSAQRSLFDRSLDPSTPAADLTALRGRANALSAVGVGLVGVAAGLAVGAAAAPSGRVPGS